MRDLSGIIFDEDALNVLSMTTDMTFWIAQSVVLRPDFVRFYMTSAS